MTSLLSFIAKYKSSNPAGWRKWVLGTLAVLSSLAVVGVYYVREFLRNRELARLQHERDVLESEARQHTVDAALTAAKEDRVAHVTAATDALQQAGEVARQIDVLEKEHSDSRSVIASLQTWSDVDAHVK